MFGGLAALAAMSEQERGDLASAMLRYMTPPGTEVVPEGEQCVNCTQRAMESGWCPECAADLFPPGWDA